MSENMATGKTEFLAAVKEANFVYNVAVERNINVHRMKEQLQNVLWTYRNEIADLADEVEAYKKQVADLNAMLDAAAAAMNTPAEENAHEATATKKKAR